MPVTRFPEARTSSAGILRAATSARRGTARSCRASCRPAAPPAPRPQCHRPPPAPSTSTDAVPREVQTRFECPREHADPHVDREVDRPMLILGTEAVRGAHVLTVHPPLDDARLDEVPSRDLAREPREPSLSHSSSERSPAYPSSASAAWPHVTRTSRVGRPDRRSTAHSLNPSTVNCRSSRCRRYSSSSSGGSPFTTWAAAVSCAARWPSRRGSTIRGGRSAAPTSAGPRTARSGRAAGAPLVRPRAAWCGPGSRRGIVQPAVPDLPADHAALTAP